MNAPDSGYIRRAQHVREFTLLNNSLIRDKRISRRARCLLAEMLSYPPNTLITMAMLLAGGTEGRDAVRSMLRELTQAGYITRERKQGADGRWTWETTVYEVPQTVAPSPENPSMVPPAEIDVCAGHSIDALPVDGQPVDKDLKTLTPKTEKTSTAEVPPEAPAPPPDDAEITRFIVKQMKTCHRKDVTPGQARYILGDIKAKAKEPPGNWFQFTATCIRNEKHLERWLPTNQPPAYKAPSERPEVSGDTMADVRARIDAIRKANATRQRTPDPLTIGSILTEAAA